MWSRDSPHRRNAQMWSSSMGNGTCRHHTAELEIATRFGSVTQSAASLRTTLRDSKFKRLHLFQSRFVPALKSPLLIAPIESFLVLKPQHSRMATAAVATPIHAFTEKAPVECVVEVSSNECDYTDPTTARKTKTCPSGLKLTPKAPGPNQLYKQKGVTYGDWRDDLIRDGYVVVKGVIPKERALAYADETFNYLENLYVLSRSCCELSTDFWTQCRRTRLQAWRHLHRSGEKPPRHEREGNDLRLRYQP